jgi:flagellar biosynthesis/type III secretory pathway M-ring protein FliF/YscJ
MMENESLREPKNTTVMFLALLVVVVVIWGIVASVMASNRRKDCERLTAEKEAIRMEADQIKQECQIKGDQAEKLRLTALEWTRQHQLQVQEEMRKKSDESAKQAKLKEAAVKKPVVAVKGKVVPVKKSSTKPSASKKGVHKAHS